MAEENNDTFSLHHKAQRPSLHLFVSCILPSAHLAPPRANYRSCIRTSTQQVLVGLCYMLGPVEMMGRQGNTTDPLREGRRWDTRCPKQKPGATPWVMLK